MLHLRSLVTLQNTQDKARLVTLFGIGLYAVWSLAYLEFGQANADEGWYLYASKLVFQGKLPYLDFAYTQMPLLPYVYGVIQIVQPSVVLGRLTSMLLSIGTLFMSIVIARRYAGAWAGAIAAVLLGAFTFGVYFNLVVKTYALVSFFFTATLFVLSSGLGERYKYPLALVFALFAAFVRVTALFFAAPIWLYVMVTSPRQGTRVLVLLESLAFCLGSAFFLLPDWSAARWDLLDSHLRHWGTSPIVDRIRDVVAARLPEIVQGFGPAVVLGAACLVFVLRSESSRAWWRERTPLVVISAGIVLFAVSHLANGIWDVEYLVPALTTFLVLLAIALGRFYAETDHASHTFLLGALLAFVVVMPLGESTQHTDLRGGRLPLAEIDQVAAVVSHNSQPGDKVLALEALAVAVDADRSALSGMTLAQFSLQDLDTVTARQLRVVNYELVTDAINRQAARVVVLTDGDWARLAGASRSDAGELRHALDQNYRQVFAMDQFGQDARNVYVYASR